MGSHEGILRLGLCQFCTSGADSDRCLGPHKPSGDLTLTKGEEYEVLDDSQDHWWQVRNKHGEEGFIPSNYVKEKDALGLQNYDWYVADMSRQRSESLLKTEDKDGCFVVRNSSQKGLYTLSFNAWTARKFDRVNVK